MRRPSPTGTQQQREKVERILAAVEPGHRSGRSEFRDWLAATVRLIPPGKRSWSNELADKMERPDYDPRLRAFENGRRTPRTELAYDVGEGLRRCGLSWCSGLLAIKQRDLLACHSVLDIASEEDSVELDLLRWYALAELSLQDDKMKDLRACMGVVTDSIHGAVQAAWRTYCRDGEIRKAHGLLGNAAQVLMDPRSGPTAMEAYTVLHERWRKKIDVKHDPILGELDQLPFMLI